MSRRLVGLRTPALPPWSPPLPAGRWRLAWQNFLTYDSRINLAGGRVGVAFQINKNLLSSSRGQSRELFADNSK